ncbi:MAG: hypothetical protein AAGB13_13065 [Cyanobacteria bacterium P01_F01_bin.33]
MKKWPVWFPLPNAWMSAIFLLFLAFGITNLMRLLFKLLSSVDPEWLQYLFGWLFNTRFSYVLFLMPVLVPVVAIAVAHHLLHIVLDRFYPDVTTPEIGMTRYVLPSITSWWEGLYGWLTLSLTSLASFVILGLFSVSYPSGFSDSFWLLRWEGLSFLTALLVWLTVAAYFYQFEYVMRRHLMSSGRSS